MLNHVRTTLLGLAAAALAIPAQAAAHPAAYSGTTRSATNEVQTITIDATSGTFLPTTGADPVAFDADAAAVDASLEGTAIGANGVSVTKAGNVFTLTFMGDNAGTNVAEVTPDNGTLAGGAGTATAGTTTQGTSSTGTRYLFANHGYPIVLNETNGVTDRGGIFYGGFPSAYRFGLTTQQKVVQARMVGAVTGAQPHATCAVAPLTNDAVIAAWQDDPATPAAEDPFYDYIPFQSTAVGLDDHAADWIDDVQTATGVDLTGMNAAAAEAACEALPGADGSSYKPADTATGAVGAIASESIIDAVEAAVAPKDAEIATLTADKAALQTANNTLTADKAALETDVTTLEGQVASITAARDTAQAALAAANQALAAIRNRAVLVTPANGRMPLGAATVMVTGPTGKNVVIRLTVSQAQATALGLSTRVIGTATGSLGARGAIVKTVSLSRAARGAIVRRDRPTPVVVAARSNGASHTATATLVV